jgi:hypothetical protein
MTIDQSALAIGTKFALVDWCLENLTLKEFW